MLIPPTGVLDDARFPSSSVTFEDGALLVREGDPADHVLVLASGKALVRTAEGVELTALGPGDLVGELSILAGGRRTADVVAVGSVTAQRFERAAFVQLLANHPDIAGEVDAEISRRLDEHHIASFVTRTLGTDVELPFDELREHIAWRWVTAGEYLYERGDPAQSGYLVISGRLRVIGVDEAGDEHTIAEIGPDDFVGESGIFESLPRRASVAAIRDSLVAEITQSAAVELLTSLTAQENVAIPLIMSGVSRTAALARAADTLATVGLADRMHHKPRGLSGGQQQRVAVARGIAHEPALLLADEPTANLDYVQAEAIIRLLRDLRDQGRIIVISTHDARLVPVADKTVQMAQVVETVHGAPQAVSYAAGETIFEQGDPPRLVYVVESGEVEVFRRLADGGETRLAALGSGKYFGELGALMGTPRAASVRAVTDCTLTAYGPHEFRQEFLGH